jgi:hypothetical protein
MVIFWFMGGQHPQTIMDPVRFFTAGFRALARLRQFAPTPTDYGDNARNRDWPTFYKTPRLRAPPMAA